ncbi:hypothetical protein JJQ59_04695 [Cupriavidus necator]|uniref:Uncharacterized protein n=1 Tax=Cupriavidus necator TaxID=106590 RepID=A0A367PTR8_CUPNE|nr:hypothetical protein [Cupriavidus necator]QQX85247.1 hypothetical protein JJQ59_04695 [Cupriavidus necator]RCJ10285.1 hypothetical protein DDK22_01095 [Cupriavidus necator]
MHKKTRNNLVSLYRSSYVRKGENGNTHGYTAATFVGSLPVDSLEVPARLAKKLSAEERLYVERVVIEPAKRAVEEHLRKEAERERDPGWRIDEAARLLREARDRVVEGAVTADAGQVARLSELIDEIGGVRDLPPPEANISNGDPLGDALAALQRAAQSVRDGHYGSAPELGVQSTGVYRAWSAITAAVDGGGKDSLLRALQAQGWVKVRKASSR